MFSEIYHCLHHSLYNYVPKNYRHSAWTVWPLKTRPKRRQLTNNMRCVNSQMSTALMSTAFYARRAEGMIFHFLEQDLWCSVFRHESVKKCYILVFFYLLVKKSKSFYLIQKILYYPLLLEIVNMEKFAERSVANSEVYLEHNFVCIWYCTNRTVPIRRIERSAVIDPRRSLIKLLKYVKCPSGDWNCAHRLPIARGIPEVFLWCSGIAVHCVKTCCSCYVIIPEEQQKNRNVNKWLYL